MTRQAYRNKFLSDSEATRLYLEHPQLKASPDDYCPTCNKDGYYYRRGERRDCDCADQLQLHKHYLRAGIGVAYQRLSWDDYEGDPVLRQVIDGYLASYENFVSRGVGLILHGSFGTGKTFAATMLIKDLVKLGYDCYSTTFASMIDMFTAGWRSDVDRRYFLDKVVLSDVLLLDDLGKELKRKNGLSEATFDDVLRRRVQDGRPTLLTTNMTRRELSEGYGGAILSLLKEVSIAHEVQGTDFRSSANARMMSEIRSGEFRPIF